MCPTCKKLYINISLWYLTLSMHILVVLLTDWLIDVRMSCCCCCLVIQLWPYSTSETEEFLVAVTPWGIPLEVPLSLLSWRCHPKIPYASPWGQFLTSRRPTEGQGGHMHPPLRFSEGNQCAWGNSIPTHLPPGTTWSSVSSQQVHHCSEADFCMHIQVIPVCGSSLALPLESPYYLHQLHSSINCQFCPKFRWWNLDFGKSWSCKFKMSVYTCCKA